MALFQQGMFQVDARDTPETIKRKRALAQQIMNGPAVAPKSTLDGVGNMFGSIMGGIAQRHMNLKADAAEKAGLDSASEAFNPLMEAFQRKIGGNEAGFPAAPANPGDTTSMATMPAPDTASARVAQAHGDSTMPAGNLSESKQAFVNALMPAAIEESKRTGVDPRIIVAQSAQETGWGRAAPGNNYFGIKSHGKAGGQTFGTHEYVDGKRVNIRDSFRTFASPADSVRGYGDFLLQNPRYKPLMAAQGLDAQLQELQKSGYATDPNYSRSVGAIARGLPMAAPAPAPEVASGLTPDALRAWGANAYAPAQGNGAVDAVNALAEGEMPNPAQWPGIQHQAAAAEQNPATWPHRQADLAAQNSPAWLRDMIAGSGVGVAESEDDILAQEQMMAAQDPQAFQPTPGTQARVQPQVQEQAFQPAPPLSAPQTVANMPVAGVPQQPTQVADASGAFPEMAGRNPQAIPAPGIDMQQIAKVLTNPFSSQEQRAFAQMLLEQQMQQSDPRYGMQLEADRLGLEKSRLEIDALRNPQAKDTDDIREYNYAKSQGYDGTFQQFMTDMKRAGATNVNLDTGTIPQGYEAIRDANGRVVRYQPIPGGPADTSLSEAAAAENQEISGDTVMGAAKRAREIATQSGRWATGIGGQMLSGIGESSAAELRRQVEVLKSNAKIENLQAMRSASPTGGALGNVSNQENEMLAAKAGALDPNARPEDFQRALDDYERTLLRTIHGKRVGDAIFDQSRESEGWQDVGGVKIRRKQ